MAKREHAPFEASGFSRDAIREQFEQNGKFQKAAKDFLELCQEAINPSMEMADVREMIVQHVLTEDIFITVFDVC